MNNRAIIQAVAAGLAATTFALATPGFARDDAKENANIRLVQDFYAELEQAAATGKLKEQVPTIAAKFVASNYVQHMEGAPSGRDGFVELMSKIPPGPPMPPAKLVAIMADGDKVIQVTSRDLPDPVARSAKSALVWNMFRVENGQLAEHWDSAPGLGPPGGRSPGAMSPGGRPPGGMPPGPPPAKP